MLSPLCTPWVDPLTVYLISTFVSWMIIICIPSILGVLHLLAIAREAGVNLDISEFDTIGSKVPLLANVAPHGHKIPLEYHCMKTLRRSNWVDCRYVYVGKYHMVDIARIGGIPVVMKELLDSGLLHGECLTVTGKTVAENLATVPSLRDIGKQDVIFPVAAPLS